jgi:hypothetical protein
MSKVCKVRMKKVVVKMVGGGIHIESRVWLALARLVSAVVLRHPTVNLLVTQSSEFS